MPTILADSFTAALGKLRNDEQKQAKLTAFDLQTDPDRPGLNFHRIDSSKDPNFWSVRVNRDLRIIVHKSGDSLMLVHVGHHDEAYRWAERRRIETHPKTGAIQIVEVRERVEEIAPPPVQGDLGLDRPEPPRTPAPKATRRLFAKLAADELLSIGVPEDWLADVAAASEDDFFALAPHLPAEAAEALLEYAATGILHPAVAQMADPLAHPDTLRRFRVLDGVEEMKAALDWPFEKWAVFLHPAQRGVVDRAWSGPARVIGSAGTGKTVVALHRVARLLHQEPQARILLTTFSDPLARALEEKLGILLGERADLLRRVTIASFERIGAELYSLLTGREPALAKPEQIRLSLMKAAEEAGETGFSQQFLLSEWAHVIDAWQIDRAEAYAEVPRMGRKNRLGARQRERLWEVFSRLRATLARRALMTPASMFAAVAAAYETRAEKPFDHIVVDEAQDLGVPELRFLAAIAPDAPDALFFAGDIGQRIFQQPFSWKGLGIDVRGRSATLKVNYRTSHQIRRAADRLLPPNVRDVDGLEDERAGTVSVFEGPEPVVVLAADEATERAAVAAFLQRAVADGISPAEIGLFVRSANELPRARAAAEEAGLAIRTLSEWRSDDGEERLLVGTMHLAKGLEFRAVAIVACDEGVLPLAERIADVADEFELDEVVTTERQLLYVALTRARDRALVSGLEPGSEFLEDLMVA
ncbi:UvrD-helicase domain-containing protein [Afifella aestuarii]|uniref:UvrD-helicase domain-containing protein n=1 Tax=Afifella aestuarii TaxID=1909496 RepID=UPI000FE3D38B|nr:UvrD-helicase domain-containing protein [Afifella aestuarii]